MPAPSSDARSVLRRRTFRTRSVSGLTDLLVQLQSERFTGKVMLNLSQGGFQDALVEDSAPLFVEQSPASRSDYLTNLRELR